MSNPFADQNYPRGTAATPPLAPSSIGPRGPLPTRIDMMRALSFMFENPNWMMNALWAFLCQLVAQVVPVVPQIPLIGYQFEIFESLLATGGTRYPDFDPSRIGDYFTRGVWPVVVVLVYTLLWSLIFIVFTIVAALGLAGLNFVAGGDAGPVLGLLGFVIVMTLALGVFMLLPMMITPPLIRSGMTQSFSEGFDTAWVMDFLGRVWRDLVVVVLTITVVSFAVTLFTCFLGFLLLIPIAPFFSAHLMYQFYAVYLSRGGRPVPAMGYGTVTPPPVTPMPPGFPPKPLS